VTTGPHTFVLKAGEVVVTGETLHPNVPSYDATVPVTAVTAVTTVTAVRGVTTVTTGYTFLPLDRTASSRLSQWYPRSRNRDRPFYWPLTVTAITGLISAVLTGNHFTCGCKLRDSCRFRLPYVHEVSS
jgi:hypothetical protein